MAEDTPVSWIDPDEVADLVRQLQGPAQKPQPGAWELHTLPSEDRAEGPAFSLMREDEDASASEEEGELVALPVDEDEPSLMAGPVDGFAPVEETPLAPAAVDPFEAAMEDSGVAEIERIRHQLRMLRQQAQQAGVIARPTEEPSSEPAEAVPTAEAPAAVPMEEVFAVKEDPHPMPEPVQEEMGFPPLHLPEAGLGDRLQAVCDWARTGTGSDEVVLIDEFGDVLCGHSDQISLVLSALMAWQSSMKNDPMQALVAAPSVARPMHDGRSIIFVPVRSHYGVVNLALVRRHELSETAVATLSQALLRAVDPVA